VWVANSRCNSYSAGNREYRSTDAGYWQSSLDELALLDLPATIDAVLRMTGAPQLSVVGHSQGAALPAMLLAARPEYNKKVFGGVLDGRRRDVVTAWDGRKGGGAAGRGRWQGAGVDVG
jgi:predicted alpha/beta hydrolase